ncbi:O-antigen ligase family protein [Vitreimonas flagellata]|uniref:O-antigen ligase family protein n=1 Tax=Vitreimonas flagellata TaxID=2560861 RepID=UPI001075351B|nr:O-antigen ligase family protein [Vitreimonas flagellata]
MTARTSHDVIGRLGAMVALGLITAGLCLGGAQSAANAALLAVLLSAALILVAANARAEALIALVNRYWLPILAAVCFITYTTATAWIATDDFAPLRDYWHPFWRQFGFDHGAISISPYRTLEGVAALFAPLAAFALGALTIHTREDRRVLSTLVLIFAALFGVLSLYWLLTGVDTRLEAQFGSANAAATTLGVFALLLAARLVRATRKPSDYVLAQPAQLRPLLLPLTAPFTFVVLALTLACLVLTGSRAGILATAAAFVIFGVLVWAPWRRTAGAAQLSRGAIFAVAILAVVLIVSGGQMLFSRLLQVGADAGVRATLLEMHWQIFLQRPLLGHGLNTFHELNAHYLTIATWRDAGDVGSVHNIYVQALEEVGIIGFVLLSLMLAPTMLRAGISAATKSSGSEWAGAAFAAATLALIHGVVDFGLQTPAIAALIMFCLGAFANGAAKRNGSKDQRN